MFSSFCSRSISPLLSVNCFEAEARARKEEGPRSLTDILDVKMDTFCVVVIVFLVIMTGLAYLLSFYTTKKSRLRLQS